MIDLTRYPMKLAKVLKQVPLMPLGPGSPQAAMRAQLEALEEADFGEVKDAGMVSACRAGLWLAFDFLDESHAISQELDTAEGSYWHAIMHRREPDAANSKYWWRRVGRHPLFAELLREAGELGYTTGEVWDPERFVASCEALRDSGNWKEDLVKQVQRVEWELLFAWCFEGVSGK